MSGLTCQADVVSGMTRCLPEDKVGELARKTYHVSMYLAAMGLAYFGAGAAAGGGAAGGAAGATGAGAAAGAAATDAAAGAAAGTAAGTAAGATGAGAVVVAGGAAAAGGAGSTAATGGVIAVLLNQAKNKFKAQLIKYFGGLPGFDADKAVVATALGASTALQDLFKKMQPDEIESWNSAVDSQDEAQMQKIMAQILEAHPEESYALLKDVGEKAGVSVSMQDAF